MSKSLLTHSIYINVPNSQDTLHLKRFEGEGDMAFMIHGAIENSRIFYSQSNKGLAPYLAKQGFDVYVLDLRGRGLSKPAINRHSKYGQTEAICQDLPLVLDKLLSLRANVKLHCLAHSWGGVLLASALARRPDYISKLASQVYFGSKRQVKVKNIWRFLYVDLIWRALCPILTLLYGYLPAKEFKMGSDNETKRSHKQSVEWVVGDWLDSVDEFDYRGQLKNSMLPPTLYFAAINDHALGNPKDVQRFMAECGLGKKRYQLLAKKTGYAVDYDHINMLTHPLAERDLFPQVTEWLHQH